MGHPVEISDATFDLMVLKSAKPVLVDFWAPWCGPCRAIAPIVEELVDEYADKVLVAKLNVDENSRTPATYNIQGIPTLLVFKNGKPLQQVVGFKGKKELKKVLDQALA